MTRISASEAKTHFGALLDKARKEPITIEKQGRPVAVVLSFEDYQEQFASGPSTRVREEAVDFLNKWSQRPPSPEPKLHDDPKAQAIWEKYTKGE